MLADIKYPSEGIMSCKKPLSTDTYLTILTPNSVRQAWRQVKDTSL